jgi:hypothetical protein
MGHPARRLARCAILLLAATLLAIPMAVGSAHAQGPDFSDVDDVLLGRRLVLPLQDVVVSAPGDQQNTIVQTDQGELSPPATYALQGTALTAASGRVFDLENDVIVTMVRTGSESAALSVRDPLGARGF